MRALLALVLLAALVPLPTAHAASWSVDVRVVVQDVDTAELRETISGLTNTQLRLPIPDAATFLDAKDVDGASLAASVQGDEVVVTIRGKPAVLRFSLAGTQDGPFGLFPVQVAAADDSPVSVAARG